MEAVEILYMSDDEELDYTNVSEEDPELADLFRWVVNLNSEGNPKIVISDNMIIDLRKHLKISRNQLCPCGSGKKYKNCCLQKEV